MRWKSQPNTKPVFMYMFLLAFRVGDSLQILHALSDFLITRKVFSAFFVQYLTVINNTNGTPAPQQYFNRFGTSSALRSSLVATPDLRITIAAK